MRTGGVGRATAGVTAALALTAVYGCTVQAPEPGSGTDPGVSDGRHRSPVRVGIPASRPPGNPGGHTPGHTPSAAGRPAPDRTTGSTAPARAVSTPVLWSRGDRGRDVRELQARLRQIAWLSDGPTGTYDGPTEQAVRGFQGKRGLPRTGRWG
jgi:hypothetical protein